MAETLLMLPAFLGGLLLGVFFYGGLWWTVKKGLTSPCPALWFSVSYLLRTGIVIATMYVLSGGRWPRLLLCFLGYFISRLIMMRLGKTAGEGGHAA